MLAASTAATARTHAANRAHLRRRARRPSIYRYDPLTFRLEHFKTTRPGASPPGTSVLLQSLAYYYDAVGNIVSTHDTANHDVYFDAVTVPSADGDFTYDAVYRLIAAEGREHAAIDGLRDEEQLAHDAFAIPHPNDPSGLRRYLETWSYDKIGNITEMVHDPDSGGTTWTRGYTYTSGTNQLATTSTGTTRNYSHDSHGNMDGMPHLDGLDYDFADQLRHVDKQTGQDVYFVYDASGQRVRKIYEHSGLIEERIYLGGYEIYRKWVGTDITTATLDTERETLHVADDARRVCMIETLTLDEEVEPDPIEPRFRFQLDNHLGTACVETDEDAAIISFEEYHAYGTSAYRAFQSTEVSAKRYRYTGKERDEETSLYYHGARYYAPWLGRWTQADPAGLVDGSGLYCYCRGSPVVCSDPSGTETIGELARRLAMDAAAEATRRSGKTASFGELKTAEQAQKNQAAQETRSAAFEARFQQAQREGKFIPSTDDPTKRETLHQEHARRYATSDGPTGPSVAESKGPFPPDFGQKSKEQVVYESIQTQARMRAHAENRPFFDEQEFRAFAFLAATFGPSAAAWSAGIGEGAAVFAADAPLGVRPQPPVSGLRPTRLGEGAVTHFTNEAGVRGITGLDPGTMKVGSPVLVQQLQFKPSTAPTLRSATGKVFVTELGPGASAGELNFVGVFESSGKQQFAIQLSRESALSAGFGVHPPGQVGASRGIFVIDAPSTLGAGSEFHFSVTRRY